MRWRCARSDCNRQISLNACSKRDCFGGTKSCDRCGARLKLSLRDTTVVLSDCPRQCQCNNNARAGSETLVVAVLPCALPSLFCGLVTPEQIYGGQEISPHSDDPGRAQVREAIWALCNSGTRLTFALKYTKPVAASTDSQGYGIDCDQASRSTIGGYELAGVDWDSALPLDWSCGCAKRTTHSEECT